VNVSLSYKVLKIESTAETHFCEKWHFQPIGFIAFKFAKIVDFDAQKRRS